MTTVDTQAVTNRADLVGTVDAVMADGAAELAVYDAVADQWRACRWSAVRERAVQIAGWIDDGRSTAPGRGDSPPPAVGLVGDPSIDLVAAIHGAWLAGSAVSILPGPIRGADESRWAAATANRFVAIGVDTVLGSGEQLTALADAGSALRVADVAGAGTGRETDGFGARGLAPDEPAILQGTAGSTGDPKTAVLTAATVATNTAALADRIRLDRRDDIGLSWLPLYHDMGLTFLLAGIYSGIPLWLAPNSAFAASPFRWPQWLTESRATITAAPNFAYDIVGRYGRLLKGSDLSQVRVAISGGEPIDPDAFDRFLAEASTVGFDPAAAAPAYGMAESTCAVTMPAAGDGARYDEVVVDAITGVPSGTRRRYPLLGTPLDGMEVRVVDADVDVPSIGGRVVGAIEIRGTSMMSGYLGHPPLDADEWFPTGDLGYVVDGEIVICGRAKEIVIVAGRNLFPVEIERAAATVDGVRRGGVVAVARGSRRPGLVVIAETRVAETRDADAVSAIRSAITSAVASECGVTPAEVIAVAPGSVPRTTSGKLRRIAARDLVESGEWSA